MEEQEKKDYLLPAAIFVAAILISGSLIYSTGKKDFDSKMQTAAVQETAPKITSPQIDDDVVLGDPEAPITIFIFSDYQCPACGLLYKEAEYQLRKNYVETKKANMVYKDFPLENIHPQARPAAEAAECAKDQNKYWAYHDALFEKQAELGSLDFVELAGTLGLNKTEFSQCYSSRKYKDEVTADLNEALSLGVRATPTIFINDKKIEGAYPYTAFSQIIDEILNKR